MNIQPTTLTTSTESTDLAEVTIDATEAVVETTVETPGSKALRFAARLTAPAKSERSLKGPLLNVAGAVVASAFMLSSITGIQGFVADRMDPRADQVAGSAEISATQAESIRANALMKHYGCSTSGLPEGVVPEHALVRLAGDVEGRVSFVSFAEGWDIHMNSELGELAAVCAK